MILENENGKFAASKIESDSFITQRQLCTLFDHRPEFKEELLDLFGIDLNTTEVIKIGNAKSLLTALGNLESQCTKIDIQVPIKNIHLHKMLEEEKATFQIYGIKEPFILKANKSDVLVAETRYSAKQDILDIYHFSKFANYCRDNVYEDLIDQVKDYLNSKNAKIM